MHTDILGNTSGEKCHAKGRGKVTKIQDIMYRDTMNVGREMYVNTGNNNCSHRNSNKENFVSHTRKAYSRFITTDSCTRNTTHNTENTAVCNFKPEQ
jgi:hypothetical protein